MGVRQRRRPGKRGGRLRDGWWRRRRDRQRHRGDVGIGRRRAGALRAHADFQGRSRRRAELAGRGAVLQELRPVRPLELRGADPSMGADRPGRPRIDRWLWAARFYKTRSLAARAVEGGKVKLNGERVKPGKEVKSGDELELRSGELQWLIEVRVVALKPGPPAVAPLLHADPPDTRATP